MSKDFIEKASMAASKHLGNQQHSIVSSNNKTTKSTKSTTTTTVAEKMGLSLFNDAPTIERAVKSYLSLILAKSMTLLSTTSSSSKSSTTMNSEKERMEALTMARQLLKAIDSTIIPKDEYNKTKSMEFDVVRITWNGLIEQQQQKQMTSEMMEKDNTKKESNKQKKPSRLLGQKSLIHAYPHILRRLEHDVKSNDDDDTYKERSLLFFRTFGSLLQNKKKNDNNDDDDSALVWDLDGGASELAKRRQRREQRRTQNQDEIKTSYGEVVHSIKESFTTTTTTTTATALESKVDCDNGNDDGIVNIKEGQTLDLDEISSKGQNANDVK